MVKEGFKMKASIAVLALAMSMAPVASQAGVVVSITVAPPVLPVYVQPAIPGEGYLWTPGYWAYGPEGYFWVPGVWIRPPQVGLLWTPGYWGWHGGIYSWNAGYWGPHVGFYGGVNYGFGFGGVGFVGGRWEGGHFAYNSAVNVGVVGGGFHSYHENVVVNNVHTSFNGGSGGIRAEATPGERSAMAEHHFEATKEQTAHHEAASHDRSQLASVNHGRPSNAAMSRPHAAASASHAAGANHPSGGGGNKAAAEHKAGGAPNKGGGASHPAAAKSGGAPNKGGGAPNKGGGGSVGKPAAAAQHSSGGGQPKGGGGGGSKGGGAKPAAHGGGKEGKK
jgi:hypothetical protein